MSDNGLPRKRVVLVVDDDEILEEYIQTVLHKHGYTSESFTDPVKAIDFFREHSEAVDLIVSDICMPRINGIELAQYAKRVKPEIPLIFVSSDGMKLDEARLIGGTQACLLKPVSRNHLTNCVESVIGPSQP
jgi:CheY-like chemotaxis protein